MSDNAAPTPRKNPVFTIFLTVFLDLLGLTIIIPVLAPLLVDSLEVFGPEVELQTRTLTLGAVIGTFALMQFFSAPFLGALSDKYGRRKVLFYSLYASLLGYILFGLGIIWGSLEIMFLGRIVGGLGSGNISVIYSSIADVSSAAEKARNFGIVGMAFGLGFVIGPVLGGFLADPEIVSWFSSSTPFFFSALLVALNIVLVYFRFPETNLHPNRELQPNLGGAMRNLVKAFGHPQLRSIFLVIFFFTFGFAFFTQFFQVFLIGKFEYDESDIGLLFGYIGVLIALTQGLLVRALSKRVGPMKLVLFCLPLLVLAFIVLVFPDTSLGLYLVMPGVAVAQGLTSPNLYAIVSNSVPEDQQGETLGMQQSMQSLGQLVPPLIGGYAVAQVLTMPIWLAAGTVFLGWVIFVWQFGKKALKEGPPQDVEAGE
ncbi:MAG: MFS transporter [Bacteroidota bacterium]